MKMDDKVIKGEVIETTESDNGYKTVKISIPKDIDLDNLQPRTEVKLTTYKKYKVICKMQEWIRLWVIGKPIYFQNNLYFKISDLFKKSKLNKQDMETIYNGLNANQFYTLEEE